MNAALRAIDRETSSCPVGIDVPISVCGIGDSGLLAGHLME